MSRIIFLNGCSSAGKTQIGKAIQDIEDRPWLLFGIDTFFDAMPAKYVADGSKAGEGIRFVPGMEGGKPVISIEVGPYGKSVLRAMVKVFRQLADDGHDLIIDEVILAERELRGYVEAFREHTVYFVGVTCDLTTLEERELLRGDRTLGLALDQVKRVHSLSCKYDVTVDTTETDSLTCARRILDFVEKNKSPKAFQEMLVGV